MTIFRAKVVLRVAAVAMVLAALFVWWAVGAIAQKQGLEAQVRTLQAEVRDRKEAWWQVRNHLGLQSQIQLLVIDGQSGPLVFLDRHQQRFEISVDGRTVKFCCDEKGKSKLLTSQ